jgi:hypothetical protein
VGPVRPEDCFPVPRVSVVRGGASASLAGREFEIAYGLPFTQDWVVIDVDSDAELNQSEGCHQLWAELCGGYE